MDHINFAEYSSFITDKVYEGDVIIVSAIVTFLVIFLTTLILLCRSTASKSTQVLLLGICDSGKSLLYSQLVLKTYTQTFTSLKENTGSYPLKDSKKSLTVVDVPGHERIRDAHFDNLKTSVSAIIFVVDSASLQKEIKDVASYLYDILTDRAIFRKKVPILVACNKQDQLKAKGCLIVKTQIEKEITIVRQTKQAALMNTEGSYQNNIYLGKQGGDFKFSDVKWKIEFVDCSAGSTKSETADTSFIEDFLIKI